MKMEMRFDRSPLEFCQGERPVDAEELKGIAGIYFLVDVWNGRADLLAMVVDANGPGKVWVLEHDLFGISYGELVGAVVREGGSLKSSGSYQVTREIEEKIRAHKTAFYGIESSSGEERPKMRFARTLLFLMPTKR
jgi:hypothetical protein